MISFSDLKREAKFAAKQRYLVLFFSAIFLLSTFSVYTGIVEIWEQQETIERLIVKDTVDRNNLLLQQKDYGSAAYYSFHLTYSEPSPLAFAAMGQRDVYPWKHRIRMLALEGQIYETDADNPELSLLGRFDFAFLVSVLMPLFVILLLHDLRSSEREAGRYDLLIVTAKKQRGLWLSRAIVLGSALSLALLVPFFVGVLFVSNEWSNALLMALTVVGHVVFWMALLFFIGSLKVMTSLSSVGNASIFTGIWLMFTVLIPVGSDTAIDEMIDSPSGGEIVLTQREAVNDAWDLPVSATWDAFLKTHPEWSDKTQMNSMFEWKWYYAFQQVGDQKAAELSMAYRTAIQKKDRVAGWVALISPPMLSQRLMSSLAKTDTSSMMAYELRVRAFHASLRQFYYPLLFENIAFSNEQFDELIQFSEFNNAVIVDEHNK